MFVTTLTATRFGLRAAAGKCATYQQSVLDDITDVIGASFLMRKVETKLASEDRAKNSTRYCIQVSRKLQSHCTRQVLFIICADKHVLHSPKEC